MNVVRYDSVDDVVTAVNGTPIVAFEDLPGADADLVLFDPNKSVTLTTDVLHENVDYTPYEGISLHGYPVLTMSRGTVLVKNGQFIGPHGHGRYIKRHSPVHMSTMQGGNSNHNKTELP